MAEELVEDLNHWMETFRVASRDIFNQHIRTPLLRTVSWFELLHAFDPIEEALFQALVVEPMELSKAHYGNLNEEIVVRIASEYTPILINRKSETNNGHWDHAVDKVTNDCVMQFQAFFDFDPARPVDHRYAMVKIFRWPSEPSLEGHYALIETQYIQYKKEAQNEQT